MSDHDREFICLKLLHVAHLAFVDIRSLALQGAESTEQIRDLADVAELIPEQVLRWDDGRYEMIRAGLAEYARKYDLIAQRLIATLDLDRVSFEQCHAEPDAELWNVDPATP
jgi:hypothetical protein